MPRSARPRHPCHLNVAFSGRAGQRTAASAGHAREERVRTVGSERSSPAATRSVFDAWASRPTHARADRDWVLTDAQQIEYESAARNVPPSFLTVAASQRTLAR